MTEAIIKPTFETVLTKDYPNFYIIGITDQSKEVEQDLLFILDSKELDKNASLNNGILVIKIKEKVYSFNLSEHLNAFLKTLTDKEFFIAFGFFDEAMQPKSLEIRGMRFEIN